MPRLGYVTLLPLLASLGFIVGYPLAYGLYASVTASNGSFVGFSYYLQAFRDSAFRNSLAVTILYAGGSTSLAFVLGLLFTLLLTQAPRGQRIFESMLLVPLAIPPIVVGVLWSPSAIWDDANAFVHFILGLPYINVLSPFFFFPVMMLSDAWEWSPLLMLISLSILGSVKREVFEAASVHGASATQIFRRITLPTLLRSPVLSFVLVLRFVDAMRAFEIPFAWSTWVGYPQEVGTPVDTVSLYLYKLLFLPFSGFPTQYIAAIAITLLAVTLVGAGVLLKLVNKLGGAR